MPRNATGTYTLVSGNPVVTGTLIASTWANTTLPDIGAALSDSLSRSGSGGMTAPLRTTNGNAAAPTQSFTNDIQTGMFLNSAGDLMLDISGTPMFRVRNDLVEIFDVATATWYKVFSTHDAVGMVKNPTILAFDTQQLFTLSTVTYVINTNNIQVF